jgi:hypothetical protein
MANASWQPEAMTTPWIDSPFFPTLLEHAQLDEATKRLVEKFADDGYVIVDSGFDRAGIDEIVRGLEGRYRAGDPEASFSNERRIQDAWRFNEGVRRLATMPSLLALLRVLYGREPIPFQTLNFRIGSEQRVHSDTLHFHCYPHRYMCGIWVALEDIDADNGPLRYYPKSHKLPIYDLHDLGYAGSKLSDRTQTYARYEDFMEQLMAASGLKPVEIRVKAGQALIWAANLAHGGTPILDAQRTRHSQVSHYYFERCIHYTPMLSDPALGRIELREVHDIRNGRRVDQHYLGASVLNPGVWPPVLADDAAAQGAPNVPTPPTPLTELGRRADQLLARGYESLRRFSPIGRHS